MSTDKNILDDSEKNSTPQVNNAFNSRVPRDLMIVFGVILTLFGISAIYAVVHEFLRLIENMRVFNLSVNEIDWLKFISRESLIVIPGILIFIGGVGLIRGTKTGWILGVASSLFFFLTPLLIGLRILIYPSIQLATFGWLALVLYLIYVAQGIFLISNPIRKHFAPSKRDYRLVLVFALMLMLNFSAMGLFF